jgi:hypothetical protein
MSDVKFRENRSVASKFAIGTPPQPPSHTHTHTHTHTHKHTHTPTQNCDVSLLPKIGVRVRERCYISCVFQFHSSHGCTE